MNVLQCCAPSSSVGSLGAGSVDDVQTAPSLFIPSAVSFTLTLRAR